MPKFVQKGHRKQKKIINEKENGEIRSYQNPKYFLKRQAKPQTEKKNIHKTYLTKDWYPEYVRTLTTQ